jgi:prevent-host-death family protein
MKIVEIKEAKDTLAEYTSTILNEPLIVTSEGKPVAALVSLENTDWETISLSTNPEFIKLIEQSRLSRCQKGGISSEEMRRRLGLAED